MPSILNFPCKDCGENTIDLFEYYMVNDEIWREAGLDPDFISWDADDTEMVAELGPPPPGEFLCIGCLEARISRLLTGADFKDVPLNSLDFDGISKSDRLIDRLTR
jgi:hypothetical protein